MELPPVALLVPHSHDMVLLDRVLAVDAESLEAEVEIRADSLFCGPQGVGGWVGIEYMAQAIAAHAGHHARLRGEPVAIGFLLGTRRYACSVGMFAVGDLLQVRVTRALQAENGLASFECAIAQAGDCIATATITVFQPANVDEFLKESTE